MTLTPFELAGASVLILVWGVVIGTVIGVYTTKRTPVTRRFRELGE